VFVFPRFQKAKEAINRGEDPPGDWTFSAWLQTLGDSYQTFQTETTPREGDGSPPPPGDVETNPLLGAPDPPQPAAEDGAPTAAGGA